MPSLGADMEEGILLEWLAKPGAVVHRGDVVAVVETPKSAVEVETFEDGVVRDLLVAEGETVPVGTVLATLGPPSGRDEQDRVQEPPHADLPRTTSSPDTDRALTPPDTDRALTPPQRHRARQRQIDLRQVSGNGSDGRNGAAARARMSPLARRLAEDAGLDASTVAGSGAGGVVRAVDVRAALAARRPAPTALVGGPADGASGALAPRTSAPVDPPRPPSADGSLTDMRRSIAAVMSRSNREIPHYHLTLAVDVQAAVDWVHAQNRELPMGQQLVPAALLLVAAARAAREVPELNGHWVDDGFRAASSVDLGLIVSLRGGGLLVPAIVGADQLGVVEMMARIRELTKRARAGRLRGSDLTAPSISVSNLGEQGADSVYGVIYPPQVALLGFGAVAQRPWAVDGLLGVRSVVTTSLAGDHRATDGAIGARLLRTIDRLLQRPEEL